MDILNRYRWVGYIASVVLEVALTAGLVALQPYFPLANYPVPYVVLLFGIAYWFGGGPALLTLLLSLFLYDYFFVPPIYTIWPSEIDLKGWAWFAAYVLGAGIVALVTIMLRRSQRRALNLTEELRESEARLRVLGDNLPDSLVYQYMYDYDSTPRFLYISSGTERLNGVNVEDVMRDAGTLLGQILPEHYQPFLEAEAASARDMSDFAIDIQMRRTDGEIRWMRLHSRPRRLPDERVVWDGVQVDVTERKQAEEALRESEARFALAQSAADIGTWEHELASGAIQWSGNLMRMFGIAASEQPPPFEKWMQMVHPDDRQRVQEDIARALKEKLPFGTEYRFVRLDGSVHWMMARAHTIYSEDGTPARLIGVLMDITETIELRQTLERHLELLQRALVPVVPSICNGCRTAAVYLPAYVGENIGGDFYDVFVTESGEVALLIGDVAGKGIGAASLAAAARSTIRAFAYELSSPGVALSHANIALASQSGEPEGFITAFLVIIDPATGRLKYAKAGHPPAAVWRTNGQVEFLEANGLPIGAITDLQYAESEDHLYPGDKIVLYTDGVSESRRDLNFFDTAGIEGALIE